MKKFLIALLLSGLSATVPAAEFADLQRLGAADLGGGPQAPLPGIAAPALPGYQDALADFEIYRRGKLEGIKNEENLPFLLDHGVRTRGAVLLIHGLTDSPWYMRELGEIIYRQGYNVVCILLPGHGTRPESLLKVTKRGWQQEVDRGVRIASGLGEKVSLGGFSTGGALSLDTLHRHPWLKPENLLLFSPALNINSKDELKASLACAAPWLAAQLLGPFNGNEAAVENHPYRYSKLAINAICQLFYLTKDNELNRAAILDKLAAGTRVFAVQSGADTTVNPDSVNRFMASTPNPGHNDYVWYPEPMGIRHEDVTRPETNPAFTGLKNRLSRFLLMGEKLSAAND